MNQTPQSRFYYTKTQLFGVLILVGAVGTLLLLRSFAATDNTTIILESNGARLDNTTVRSDPDTGDNNYVTLASSDNPPADPTCANSLGSKLAARGILFGAAVHIEGLALEEFKTTVSCHFSGVVAENAMKWDETQNPLGTFTFEAGDEIVNFATTNNLDVRGHTLIWHGQSSSADSLTCDRSTYLAAMKTHITKVMEHYHGKVQHWDVVNEAFNEDGSLRPSKWQQCVGDDYIEQAFAMARQADPSVALFYNDYNNHYPGKKLDAIVALTKDLYNKELLDGVGMQAHISPQLYGFDKNQFSQALESLASTGAEVAITEADVLIDGPQNYGLQAQVYADMLASCLKVTTCKTFFVWGVSDQHSWISGPPLLFDSTFKPKPAYRAMLELL